MKINKTDFINALKFAIVATGKQDVRYYFNGVLFHFTSDGLMIVASDGHRINQCRLEVEVPFDLMNEQVIVERDVIEAIIKTVKPERKGTEKEQELNVHLTYEEKLKLTEGALSFELTAIDGVFPQYQQITGNYDSGIKAVENIAADMNYLADVKKAFNHLSIKSKGIKISFKGDAGAMRFTLGENTYSVKQLKDAFMLLIPVRL